MAGGGDTESGQGRALRAYVARVVILTASGAGAGVARQDERRSVAPDGGVGDCPGVVRFARPGTWVMVICRVVSDRAGPRVTA